VLFRKDFAPYQTRYFLNIDEDDKEETYYE
jgi:hypothetical protein